MARSRSFGPYNRKEIQVIRELWDVPLVGFSSWGEIGNLPGGDCGLHNTGPVVAAVIGKRKFSYDLWGDAVNVASRMESQGLPGRIHLTESTYRLLEHSHTFESRGKIEIKDKGAMNTYLCSWD